ncbi:cytochrome P450 [Aaosphaeria arxii CBS 175.79]|uniref:Cytochrome P450 n=1 Tax=Aaosphaeria arxii CBS 175.79 TaxID=1450172 RepID=A0A6A5X8S1_9PLEO|nr:cytochrome P450 [Aaosphaeria arxii CBS 175.79]KAF2009358.1 cytochrome P450 [Aaosphaeria arxii CBS 175.79]
MGAEVGTFAAQASFERSNLQDLSILSREVDSFLERLPKDGSTIDLQPMLYVMVRSLDPMIFLTLTQGIIQFSNSALSFILGPHPFEVSASAPLTPDEFVRSFHDGLLYSMFRTVLGRVWNILPQAKYINACVRTHEFIDYYVEKMFDDNFTTGVINNAGSSMRNLPSLMQALSSPTNDRDYIRYQVIQGLMAAQDTTSELLTNSLFLLARQSKYWERLRTEVTQQADAFFQVDKFTKSTLIRNVLLETLRLYPIFPLLGRIALQDTQLPVGGGSDQNHPVFIPKGTMVIISYYAVHRNNAVFGNDIDAFRPDLWDSIRPSQWEFYGFGAGYRACLGQQKAMIESSYVLVRMAYELEKIHSRDSREWKGGLKLTCKSAHGCKLAFN